MGSHLCVMTNSSSIGHKELLTKLLEQNPTEDQQLDYQNKLWAFTLGTHPIDGSIIYNNGNRIIIDLNLIKNKINNFDKYLEIFSSKGHVYRELINRHSHGNNKPSYWALGYKTIYQMKSLITKEQWDEYASKHVDCCGLNLNIVNY